MNFINALNYLPGQLWGMLHDEVLVVAQWASGKRGGYKPFEHTDPVSE